MIAESFSNDLVEPEIAAYPHETEQQMMLFFAALSTLNYLVRVVNSRQCLETMNLKMRETHGVLHKRLKQSEPIKQPTEQKRTKFG